MSAASRRLFTTFRWSWRDGWEDGLSDDVVRSRVDVLFTDADVSRIHQFLSDHVIATLTTVQLAVCSELAEWQSLWRRGDKQNFLTNHVVATVVVLKGTLVVCGGCPRLTQRRLTKDVVTQTLKMQSQIAHLLINR